MSEWRVIVGDCIERMREMPDCSVDSIVSDPPYGLGFMGKKWDDLPPGVEWAEECLRVLKPGGFLLAFGGTRTYHRLACAIEDGEFEIRDCVAWMYGTGFPKSHNLDGDWQGFGTALKPAFEPIVVARKPLIGTVSANVLAHGTGALNIDGCRIETTDSLGGGAETVTRSDQKGNEGWTRPWMEDANAQEAHAARVRENVTKAESLGRWPANVVLDEEAAALLDEQSGIAKPKLGRSGKRGGNGFGMFDDDKSANADGVWPADPGGGVSRFFYCAKASKSERDAGLGTHEETTDPAHRRTNLPDNPYLRAVTPRRNAHPTVKPISLMRWLVRLVTPPGGTVLDPFLGSGTTGCAAVLEGMDFVGIERDPEYVKIAEARIAHWEPQPEPEWPDGLEQLGLEVA